jgi:3-isopropylmalate/(R)-2-methylmalate dehydratase small subunit
MSDMRIETERLPRIEGRVAWVFDEEDYDIDQIIGVKNIRIQDLEELCNIAMATYDPGFRAAARPGDILVGGANFGFGHPHSPPMRAMRHMGIAGVIAESFAPTYYRGETAMGFPQITCPGILQAVSRWDVLHVDWAAGLIRNRTRGTVLPFDMPGQTECNLLIHGGHLKYLQHSMTFSMQDKE